MPISTRAARFFGQNNSSIADGLGWQARLEQAGGYGEHRGAFDFNLRAAFGAADAAGAPARSQAPQANVSVLGKAGAAGAASLAAPSLPQALSPTSAAPGEIAIIAYNTGQSDGSGNPPTVDALRFVAMSDIAAGTIIYFTDRTWNGTAFVGGANDGTATWTAPGGGVARGTTINLTGAALGTLNPEEAGDAIYAYVGTTADAPTTFLFAIEIGDGNTTFNGSLVNTGLVNGANAVAVGHDSSSYQGPTTEAYAHLHNNETLLENISDFTNWEGDNRSGGGVNPLDHVDHDGPYFTAPDFSIWIAAVGGGNAIASVHGDAAVGSGADAFNLSFRYTIDNEDLTVTFVRPSDIVFDTARGLFFVADSNSSGGTNRIFQGNIADLIGNPGNPPTLTLLYTSNQAPGAQAQIRDLEVDPNNGIVYFTHGERFEKIVYNNTGQTSTVLANFETGNPLGPGNYFIDDFVINFATGTVYLTSHDVMSAADGDVLNKNHLYRITGLDAGDGTNAFTFANGGITFMNFSPDDNDVAPNPIPVDGEGFPQEEGTLEGLAISADGNTLYFTTASVLFDHDGDGGFVGDGNPGTTDPQLIMGGVFSYALTGNAAGVYTQIYQQVAGTGPQGLLDDIEIDPVTGHLYFTDISGLQIAPGNNPPGDEGIWRIALNGTQLTFFQPIHNINSLGANNIVLNRAPTITSDTEATPTATETAGLGSGFTNLVQPLTAIDVTDFETADQTRQLFGATVRIATNFQNGAGHDDRLTVNGLESGSLVFGANTIAFSYNSNTGAMTFTGSATFDNYEAALVMVRFSTTGDNPTNYGTATNRVIAWSVSDGLNHSDEGSTTITVTGINDAPVNTIQGAALGISEDALNVVLSTAGNAISVNDVDADPATQDIRVTLSVTQGTLTILTNVSGGIVGGDITGGANGTSTITITATQNQINATLAAVNGLLYNPIADYNGSDTLTIVTNDLGLNGTDPLLTGDGASEQDSDSRTINIAAVVDIANDPVTVAEDSGTTTIDVLGNDSFENAGRFISLVTQGLHGTVAIVDGPTTPGIMDYVTYTPIADYNGSDSFTYTVTSGGVTETATVNVTVTAVVDIADDTLPLAEDAGTTLVDVLFNDSFENAARFISGVTQGAHGVVTIVDGPSTPGIMDYVTYTAVADYNGTDSFTYTVTSGGVTETATVNVTISAVADIMNDLVTVDEDSGTTNLNGVGNISLIANDNFENAGRAITSVTQGANGGTVAIHNNGTPLDATDDYVSYTPALHYNGPDSFTYTVTSGGVTETATVNVTVNARNDAPVNTVGAPVIISEDATNVPLTGMSIADVDVDPANDPITVILVVGNGVLNISETVLNGLTAANITDNGTGSVTIIATLNQINATFANATGVLYTPTTNYNGSDTLTLTTNDGGFTGADGALEDSDDRAITVNAVNDTPVVTLAATGSSTEQVAGAVDATATIADADLDALGGGNGNYAGATLTIANNGGNDANDLFAIGTSGAFTVNGANLEAGGLVFATFSGGNGTPLVVSFTSSGTAATTALVNAVVQSIQYTYTGDNPPVGGIDVAISLNDGAPVNAGQGSIAGHPATGTDIIHLSITNTPENQAPVVDLDANDSNTVGTGFSASYTEEGAAAVIADTDVSITDADVGDQVEGATITITDAIAGDQLTVVGVLPGSIVAVGGGTATITLSGTGTQAEYQQALTQIVYSSTSNDPTAGGTDLTRSITVTVTDGSDPSAPATTTVTVTGSNDAPAGTDATITINEDTARVLVAADFGFTDPDSADVLGSVTITGVTGGTLYYDADGTGGAGLPVAVGSFPQTYTAAELAAGNVSFQASANLNGTGVATLTFQVIDNSGAVNNTDTSANTLTFDVTAVNDAPTLTDFGPSVTFAENIVNAGAQLLDASVTFDDVEGNFDGGTLALSGGLAEDVLGIRNEGIGAGEIGVSGSNVTYGNVLIGTVAGGTGGTPLTVTLNAAATSAAVDALIQNLTYANGSDNPTASRTLILNVTDAAGGDLGPAAVLATFAPLVGAANPFNGVDVGFYATPSFVDLDDDGDLDAVIGNNDGILTSFENNGGTFTLLAGALNPFNGLDIGTNVSPTFVDLDNDNDLDAVFGDTTGHLRAFANNGGVFTELTGLSNPFDGIDVGDDANPAFADVDGDLDLDLVVGNDAGNVLTYGNAAGVYTLLVGAANPFDGLDVGGRATPDFVDLDGDGDLDAVIGALDGQLRSFRNDGGGVFTELVGAANPFNGVDIGVTSSPSFVDLDGDGDMDALVGEYEGGIFAFQNNTPRGQTIVVNVTAENDAPAGTDATITINEDTARVLVAADFGFTDPDSADVLGSVTITGVTGGTLYYDADGTGGAGLPVAVGSFPQTYTAAELAAGNVSYQANSNLNGTGVGTISFQVIDNSGAPNNTDPSVNTLTVNVTPINDQPNIPNSPTVTTDEQVAVTLNAAITVSDVDLDARNGGAGDYSGAAFAINRSVSNAEDVFSFNTVGAQFTVNGGNLESGGNVIATLAQSGGILNINFVNNGTVPTTALVNDVLQHLQYTNTSNEPPASVTLIYIIDDGAPGGGQGALGAPFNNIDGGQVIVNVNPVNDIPAVDLDSTTAGQDFVAAYTENGAPVLITPNALVSDVDSANFSGGQLGVFFASNGNIGDSFSIISTGTGPGQISTSGSNVLYEGVVIATGTHGSGSMVLNLNANATPAAIQALLRQVAISSTRDSFAASSWNVTIELNDGDGSQFVPGSVFAGGVINITVVNDAPSGTNNTVTGSEDDPYVFTLADFGFSDPADLDDPADFAGVIFTTVPTTGTLFYDADGPGGAAPVALADGAGPIAAADIAAGRVYFVPVADATGSPYASFTFQVQDDGGTALGGVDTDQSPNTMVINVAPDNLPPAVDLDGGAGGVNYTASYIEDAPGVAIGSGVAVSDPDSGLGDMIESAVVTLTDRVAGDALTLTGVLPPGFLAVTNLAAGSITMTITGSGTGAQYQALIESVLYSTTSQDPTVGGTDTARTITVVVNDGTVNSAVATTTVNITATDDAPTAQADAYTISESGTIVAGNLFADNGSGADSDPDGPPLAVSAVGGGPGANVGTQFTLDSGATLTVNANGTFDYNPGSVFLPTPTAGSGASNTPSHDSFTYTVAGGNTVTVSITLTGLDTDDTLLGTAGTDSLTGGNGNDIYYIENASDQVNEFIGGGDDRVIASVSYALVGGTHVETLEAAAGTAALTLIGNAFDNDVIGNAGANVLHGGGGAGDVLTGLAGDDVYYTDVATTEVVEVGGGGNDTLYASVSYTLGGNADVETLSTNDYGSTAGIALTGNYLNQTLIGNAGANILHGGGGTDILIGLAGNDIYYVDVAATSVQEVAGGGNDIVYASISYALAAGQSVDILSTNNLAATAAINLTGNGLAQTVFGNEGANILHGGGGTDMLYGLGGNDIYYVDDGTARVFENAGAGSDSVYASVTFALGADQEIELLSANSYASTSAIGLTGNNFANTIIGNAGANLIDGQSGNDTLIGLDGADTYAFTTALGAGNVDNVLGFVHGIDTIALDDAVFTGVGGLGALGANAFHTGAAAADADDRIIYNSATGQLFYDADGNGAGAAVQFANLSPGLGLTASDFTVI